MTLYKFILMWKSSVGVFRTVVYRGAFQRCTVLLQTSSTVGCFEGRL
jgi:hypothetical protein